MLVTRSRVLAVEEEVRNYISKQETILFPKGLNVRLRERGNVGVKNESKVFSLGKQCNEVFTEIGKNGGRS